MTEPTVTLTANEYAIFLQKTTLRDQFAMAALPAVMDKVGGFHPTLHAEDAYRVADAMLEARKEKK